MVQEAFVGDILERGVAALEQAGQEIRDHQWTQFSCEDLLKRIFARPFQQGPVRCFREVPYVDLAPAGGGNPLTRLDFIFLRLEDGHQIFVEVKQVHNRTQDNYREDIKADIRRLQTIPANLGTRLFLVFLTGWNEEPGDWWLEWARQDDPVPWKVFRRFQKGELHFALAVRPVD